MNVMVSKPNIKLTGYYGFVDRLEDKKRQKKYKKFRLKNGFDPTECFSLDYTIAKFIYPRIKYFREHTPGYPSYSTFEKWKKILHKIEKAFYLLSVRDDWNYSEDVRDKNWEIIDKGMDLFRKHYFDLWM